MNAKFKNFLKELSSDVELRKEFLDSMGDQGEQFIKFVNEAAKQMSDFAKSKGYDLEDDDVVESCVVKLPDEELEEIAGGKMEYNARTDRWMSDCFCFMGGGGTSDEYQETCACVLGGGGEFTQKGKEVIKSHEHDASCPLVCVCMGTTAYPDHKH